VTDEQTDGRTDKITTPKTAIARAVKTADPIAMPFGLWAWMVHFPKLPVPSWERAI